MARMPALPAAVEPAPGASSLRWLLLATMAAWGANLSIVKWLVGRHDPLAVGTLRMLAAGLVLAGVLAWQWRRALQARDVAAPSLGWRGWGVLALCALLMVYLNQILLTEGLVRTSAANAALIIALNPLLSSTLALLLLGDRLSPVRLVGMALGFGGVAMVVLNRPGAVLAAGGLGDLLVFGSVATWVLGGVMVQRLGRRHDAVQISGGIHSLGALMLLAHMLLRPGPWGLDEARFGATDALLIVLSALTATALGALVWNRALTTLGVARTSLYVYWVPIFGVLFAVGLLGEAVSAWHLAGLAAVLAGTRLGTR
jgi:drug/metabolite transporter (DMT)-like permease